ncbi:NAD(P)-dependent oxidoreductase [Sodalis ligni]|jgi:3-hydroxyisobutyrate dehydrogenase-like beta-hydroxyacid dehydrogenase|uniref:3-hydroxyisobutyrate dehydrogenase n=1 Tax=Sodalis ligni TaxID=2697027 RepID=A0A4R1NFJ8_9GAMM|nr:NAD(P)-dependent oxidoreductase [Sodalis ligni]QWA13007.1 NAD(P)-dependent oxidoreductase [Sodalis ligni]TCL03446.1 3-hydroxyisobutyrate dehydrogenase [Sodalis ligni]
MNIGMIGLGQMGWNLAKNLSVAGYSVAGFDPRPDSRQRMAQINVQAADSPASLAAGTDAAVLMVLNSEQAESAVWGENGFAAGAAIDKTLIIMSSLSPVFVRALAARAEGRFRVLDAPVSGGVEGARAATLTIMASGPADLQQAMMPVLRAMGKNVINVGHEAGLGATMKTINQAMLFAALASASEMVVAGVKAGLDPDTIIKVISISSGGSWALEHRVPLAWQTDYVSGATLAIAAKDMRSATELADSLGTSATIAREVRRLVDIGMARHQGEGDDPLMVEIIEQLSDFYIKSRTGAVSL